MLWWEGKAQESQERGELRGPGLLECQRAEARSRLPVPWRWPQSGDFPSRPPSCSPFPGERWEIRIMECGVAGEPGGRARRA